MTMIQFIKFLLFPSQSRLERSRHVLCPTTLPFGGLYSPPLFNLCFTSMKKIPFFPSPTLYLLPIFLFTSSLFKTTQNSTLFVVIQQHLLLLGRLTSPFPTHSCHVQNRDRSSYQSSKALLTPYTLMYFVSVSVITVLETSIKRTP